jgi:hypothetical protein
MNNPYSDLPEIAFWKTAVASRTPRAVSGLWDPKQPISPQQKIATMGSCFAQHIGRALVARGYHWFDAERAPEQLSPDARAHHNYGIFSARTGNVYTAAALRQWMLWALGKETPPDEVWQKDGRFFDPFRPAIAANGFASPEELFRSRAVTLGALARIAVEADILVFTMGLTEAWINTSAGHVYAMCPGTIAGEFDPSLHAFKNCRFAEILADMERVIDALRMANPRIRLVLTVSPVPLTATASGKHVLTATTYSKSVLRAVAGQLADTYECVDYFPSYEIITGIPFRSAFYESNLRSVATEGVAFVMDSFFACLAEKFGPRSGIPAAVERHAGNGAGGAEVPSTLSAGRRPPRRGKSQDDEDDDVVCEEQMLAAFAPAEQRAPERARSTSGKLRRICIIGDSHIAALKLAVDRKLFDEPDTDLVFWGFTRVQFNNITLRDGKLVPPNAKRALQLSGGRYRELDVADFDALVFVGGSFRATEILCGARRDPVEDLTRLDPSLLRRRLRNRMDRTFMIPLMTAVAQQHAGAVLYVPTPMICEALGEHSDVTVRDAEWELFNQTIGEILAGQNVTYVRQPAHTVKLNKWTRDEFSLAAAKESNWGLPIERPPHIRGQYTHMNSTYGAAILAAVQDRLEQGSVGRPRVADAAGIRRFEGEMLLMGR